MKQQNKNFFQKQGWGIYGFYFYFNWGTIIITSSSLGSGFNFKANSSKLVFPNNVFGANAMNHIILMEIPGKSSLGYPLFFFGRYNSNVHSSN